ncbi:hypothetical protein E1211_23095, partial [Micromonospora sp. 15K316]
MLTRGGRGTPARPPRAGAPRPAPARHRSIARIAGPALVLALVAAGIAPATAARRVDPGGSCPPEQHDCSVWDDDPGTPGGGGDGGG